MNKIYLFLLVLVSTSCKTKAEKNENNSNRLREKAAQAQKYCRDNELNEEACVLIDMKIPSGKKRFFLWDFKGDSILKSGVCSHGSCGNLKEYDAGKSPQFSNVPNSHCSSLGKYKIGKRGYSSFGININYKLHGLEKSNDNAYSRFIVFHSWGIPDEEVYPLEIAESWGCPAVSNHFMKEMDGVLIEKEKSLLLWIFN